MFKNYGHWGINYFPILSSLITVLWLVLVITGFKVKLRNKAILYVGHFFFFLIMISTLVYFAPFLLPHMGHPQNNISDRDIASMLHTWAKWNFARQLMGLIPLTIFMHTYSKLGVVTANK